MIAAAVTYKLSALEHQGRYAERERVSKVVCGTTEELVRCISSPTDLIHCKLVQMSLNIDIAR